MMRVLLDASMHTPAGASRKASPNTSSQLAACHNHQMASQERGIDNSHTLAYQSRVGPVEWLKPYTDETIRRLGEQVQSS